jgi:hypothetical protein
VYTTRNNLDGPGLTNETPPVTDHCARVTSKDGRIVFAPPGEGVGSRFDKDGFTASILGRVTGKGITVGGIHYPRAMVTQTVIESLWHPLQDSRCLTVLPGRL